VGGFIFSCLKHQKTLGFLGGLLTATLGVSIAKSAPVRKLAVRALAKGIQLQEDARATIQALKEEAEDIHAEAKAKNELRED
jgi:hypothetical protein